MYIVDFHSFVACIPPKISNFLLKYTKLFPDRGDGENPFIQICFH